MDVTYNGNSLGFVQTTELSQVAEMDPSGSDELYDVIRFRCRSVLTGYVANANYVPPALPAETTAASVCDRIKHELSLVRRPLLVESNGTKLIDLPKGRDDVTGPIPFGVEVTQAIDGGFLVTWGVEVRLSACKGKPSNFVPLVLSNRWSETCSIDDRWLTTVTRRGKLVLSGRAGQSPDDFRNHVTPEVRTAFTREKAEYAISENGLECIYEFTDKEQAVMPPWPAVKASGEMAVTAVMPGAVRFGQLELRLEGAATTPKKDLLDAALRIGLTRALAGGLVKSGAHYPIGGGIVDEMFANAVRLNLRWLVQANREREQPKPGVFGAFGFGLIGGLLLNLGGVGGVNDKGQPNEPPVQDPKNQPGIFQRALIGLPGFIVNGGAAAIANALNLNPFGPAQVVNNPGGKAKPPTPPENPPPWLPGAVGGGAVVGAQAGQAIPAPGPGGKVVPAGLTVAVTDWLGTPLPGVSDERGLAPPLRGTADALRLVAAVLRDPCLQETIKLQQDPGQGFTGVMEGKARIVQLPQLPEIDLTVPALYADATTGAYEQFDVTLHYKWKEGVTVQPSTTGTGKQTSILNEDGTAAGTSGYEKPEAHHTARMHNPVLHLEVHLTAKRVGGPPTLPDPRKTDGNAVFMGGTVSHSGIDLAADGLNPVYAVALVLNYTFLRPHEVNVAAPVPPFLAKDKAAEARMAAAFVSSAILFPKPVPAGPGPVPPGPNYFTGTGLKDVDAPAAGQPGRPNPA